MPDSTTPVRWCIACGDGLPAAASFCPSCGEPVYQRAAQRGKPIDYRPGDEPRVDEKSTQNPETPAPHPRAVRGVSRWLVGGLVGLVVIAGVAAAGWYGRAWQEDANAQRTPQAQSIWETQRTDDYLAALKAARLAGQFSSDAAAIAHANAVCAKLNGGGEQQGTQVDLLGVRAFCPQFAEGFKILDTKTIYGTFELLDVDMLSIAELGANECTGINGYSDIHEGTEVVVRDGSGKFIASTRLKQGEGVAALCQFPFNIDLAEGADVYVFTVSRRGDLYFTWEELTNRPVIRLHLR